MHWAPGAILRLKEQDAMVREGDLAWSSQGAQFQP
jgi:hypothetical protein